MTARLDLDPRIFNVTGPRCAFWLTPLAEPLNLTVPSKLRQDHYLNQVPLDSSAQSLIHKLQIITSSITQFILHHLNDLYSGIQAGDILTIDGTNSITSLLYWNGTNVKTLFHYGHDVYGISPSIMVDDNNFNPYYWQGFPLAYNISTNIRNQIIQNIQNNSEVNYQINNTNYVYKLSAFKEDAILDIQDTRIPFITESTGFDRTLISYSTSPNGLYDYPQLNDVITYITTKR